ncbi:hypothetical protein Pse7367_0566 [Thalassoporum mexicanum PCC 7367]|uniref:protein phosphatase 2C domain-containing protein n=1 Tax=Thalassoporum mexicanum TaxID=3457544 RepID=UPI00029F8CB8|nr:protein phosphatase 2C domain-containing protein [Pseudanabaena sp. PCC 7367]AFY68871.1 hypothetical protein Pse7367_0566 [Pseudanabaena sp. PCC 7367]
MKAKPEPESESAQSASIEQEKPQSSNGQPANLASLFEVASGSVMGRHHRLNGKNNQDASYYATNDAAMAAVVCDGCGSCQHSEVGAKLGAKLVVNTLLQMLVCPPGGKVADPTNNFFWQLLKQNLVEQLGRVAIALAGFCPQPDTRFANHPQAYLPEVKQVITDYLLFTVVGALITPQITVLFSIGDGLVCLNEQTIRIGPFPGNAPPYIAYALLKPKHGMVLPSDLSIHAQRSTSVVNSILLGTDGVDDLIAMAGQKLPDKHELVGPVSQFWQSDRYFYNPDLVRRKLWLINQEGVKPNWSSRRLHKQPGLLPDDTTLIAIRRIGTMQSDRNLAATEEELTTIQSVAPRKIPQKTSSKTPKKMK